MYTGISMISMFENNKDVEDLTVYLFSKNITDTSIQQLSDIANEYGRKFVNIPLSTILYDLNVKETERHIITVYAKLFFSRIDEIEKIIYLDSDTIVNSSLREMWSIDLRNNLVAGVETFSVKVKNELGLTKGDKFINDGVVVLNLKKLRSENMEQNFLQFINQYKGAPPFLSEGTINVVCKGQIKTIHPKFNLMSGLLTIQNRSYYKSENLGGYYNDATINEAIRNPVVIHYLAAFFNRPWDKNCRHPLKNIYLKYKEMSPWCEVPLTDKKLKLRLRLIGFMIDNLPDQIFVLLRRISSFIKTKNH
ncbi:MAG: hypothetical protein HUJ22_00330 [Gracilimonas sp.]|nr:hypothetical protein [Gracilimonas sp.]